MLAIKWCRGCFAFLTFADDMTPTRFYTCSISRNEPDADCVKHLFNQKFGKGVLYLFTVRAQLALPSYLAREF